MITNIKFVKRLSKYFMKMRDQLKLVWGHIQRFPILEESIILLILTRTLLVHFEHPIVCLSIRLLFYLIRYTLNGIKAIRESKKINLLLAMPLLMKKDEATTREMAQHMSETVIRSKSKKLTAEQVQNWSEQAIALSRGSPATKPVCLPIESAMSKIGVPHFSGASQEAILNDVALIQMVSRENLWGAGKTDEVLLSCIRPEDNSFDVHRFLAKAIMAGSRSLENHYKSLCRVEYIPCTSSSNSTSSSTSLELQVGSAKLGGIKGGHSSSLSESSSLSGHYQMLDEFALQRSCYSVLKLYDEELFSPEERIELLESLANSQSIEISRSLSMELFGEKATMMQLTTSSNNILVVGEEMVAKVHHHFSMLELLDTLANKKTSLPLRDIDGSVLEGKPVMRVRSSGTYSLDDQFHRRMQFSEGYPDGFSETSADDRSSVSSTEIDNALIAASKSTSISLEEAGEVPSIPEIKSILKIDVEASVEISEPQTTPSSMSTILVDDFGSSLVDITKAI
jgi:hypothetical protein